jgi:DMSO/TMAO reductase YedYZ heme-binding membrane subunit
MSLFITDNLGILLTPIIYILVFYFGKQFKKNAYLIELTVLIFISLITLISLDIFGFRLLFVENFLNSGHLSVGFFLLVMLAGILPKKSTPYKTLLLVRGELAIMGFIFLLPHALNKLSLALSLYNFTGLIAFILFIPLVYTSFMPIRKKMNPKNWKTLHKLSYVAYIMLYIHLGFDIFIGSTFYFALGRNSILYHVLFLLYFVIKGYQIILKKKKLATK